MKKSIFCAVAVLVVSATVDVGVKAYNYYSMPELMRANLEALSLNDDNTTKCPDINYVPDRFLEVKMETYDIKCTKKGELNINANGYGTIKGSYEKNRSYPIVFEVKNCHGVAIGACCDQRNIGAKLISY